MNKIKTMKELPDADRPYEKCLQKGAQALSDAELLSVIIRTGMEKEPAIMLAQRILTAGSDGILNLSTMSVKDLMKLPGIGKVKAVQLKCVMELSKRISMASRGKKVCMNDAESIADYYMNQMRFEEREVVVVAMFDIQNAFLGDAVMSVGTAHSSLVSPPEIFQKALMAGAAHIVLLHNHPSGMPNPSLEDRDITRQVARCGDMLGIYLMDHIIIGDNRYYSFREMHFFDDLPDWAEEMDESVDLR